MRRSRGSQREQPPRPRQELFLPGEGACAVCGADAAFQIGPPTYKERQRLCFGHWSLLPEHVTRQIDKMNEVAEG